MDGAGADGSAEGLRCVFDHIILYVQQSQVAPANYQSSTESDSWQAFASQLVTTAAGNSSQLAAPSFRTAVPF